MILQLCIQANFYKSDRNRTCNSKLNALILYIYKKNLINILNSFQYEQINMKETTISCREMKVNKEKRKKK